MDSTNSPERAGCLALVAGIVLVVSALIGGFREMRYRVSGATTTGTVTYTWTQPTKSRSIQNCYYAFQVDGREYTGKDQGCGGSTVWVEYIRGNPADNRRAGSGDLRLAFGALGVGVLLIGFGVFGISRNDSLISG